jgi:AAA domain-containing protein/CHC2-type zinc finger protein/Toprim domain-containing protein
MSIDLSPSEIRTYLAARHLKLQPQGKEFRGPCPIHKGKRDSFAVNSVTGAWQCFSECARGGSLFGLEMELSGSAFPEALAEVFRIVGRPQPNGNQKERLLTTYDYTDENGNLLFQCVRFMPKEFRQRRPDGKGGWIWNLENMRRVLYRLPRLATAEQVLIVEGEKDVHALERLGFVATCNPMGAGKWREEYSNTLAGKDVVIFPDQDEPGRKHAEQVRRSLTGKARSVLIVPVGQGKDVSDWIAGGATRETIEVAIRAVADQQPAPSRSAAHAKTIKTPDRFNAEDLLAADIPEPEALIDHLLHPGVCMLAGRPKIAKSWLALHTALALVTGQSLAGHFRVRKPKRLLYCALEERKWRTRSRLKKLLRGAQPDALRDLHFIYELDSLHAGGAAQLDSLLTAHPVDVLIIDTLLASTKGIKQSHDILRDDYAHVDLFQQIADKHKVTILLVHHTKKPILGVTTDDIDSVTGTTGTTAAIDCVWHLRRGQASNSRLLSTTGRDVESELYELTFDLDQGGFLFVGQGEEANQSAERKEILDLLATCEPGETLTPKQIASELKKNPITVRRLLQKLYAIDLVCKTLSGNAYFVRSAGTPASGVRPS